MQGTSVPSLEVDRQTDDEVPLPDATHASTESPEEFVTMVFGRFNPPHRGHQKLFEEMLTRSNGGKALVFPSHTHKPGRKDPLPAAEKIEILKMIVPDGVTVVPMGTTSSRGKKVSTIGGALEYANELPGIKNLRLILGSDRASALGKVARDYNGKDWNFDRIEVVSIPRNEEFDGVKGYSASKQRLAAIEGRFADFERASPEGIDAFHLYTLIRDQFSQAGRSLSPEIPGAGESKTGEVSKKSSFSFNSYKEMRSRKSRRTSRKRRSSRRHTPKTRRSYRRSCTSTRRMSKRRSRRQTNRRKFSMRLNRVAKSRRRRVSRSKTRQRSVRRRRRSRFRMNDEQKLQACYQFAQGKCITKQDLPWTGKPEALSNCNAVPTSCELYKLDSQKSWREKRKEYYNISKQVKELGAKTEASKQMAKTLTGKAQILADKSQGYYPQFMKAASDMAQNAVNADATAATMNKELAIAKQKRQSVWDELENARKGGNAALNNRFTLNKLAKEKAVKTSKALQVMEKQVQLDEKKKQLADANEKEAKQAVQKTEEELKMKKVKEEAANAQAEAAVVASNRTRQVAEIAKAEESDAQGNLASTVEVLNENKAATQAAEGQEAAAEESVVASKVAMAAALS